VKSWPGWLVVLAGICGAGCDAGSGTTTPNPSDVRPANGTVVRVIDGDTVDIDFGGTKERVRLIGIDTPETKKPNTPIECFGPEASEYTHALLPEGTRVAVSRDAEARDDYGRLLVYVYRSADGLFVNLAIVAGGYARPLTIAPNDHFASRFVQAAHDAEAADTGLWGNCSG
jgi:micrococcal nuclease